MADLRAQSVVAVAWGAARHEPPVLGPVDPAGVLPMKPRPHFHWMLLRILEFVGADEAKVRSTCTCESKWRPVWSEQDVQRVSAQHPEVNCVEGGRAVATGLILPPTRFASCSATASKVRTLEAVRAARAPRALKRLPRTPHPPARQWLRGKGGVSRVASPLLV